MKTRLLLLMMTFAASAFTQQGFSVAVNKDNPATSITKAQLRRMMMGETPSWPGGAKVMIVLGPAGDSSRVAALKQICGMTEADFAKQVLQASFAGGGASPVKTLPSASSVRKVVAIAAGALGIVDGPQAGTGIKILTIE